MKSRLQEIGVLGVVLLAMLGGHAREAVGSELELTGKSVAVYPVGIDRSGASEEFDFKDRVAEVIGVFLERAGMSPEIASNSVAVTPADSLSAVEDKIRESRSKRRIDTDYTLFVSFTGKPAATGPILSKVSMVLTDTAGDTVWSREDTEFPDGAPDSPMAACVHVAKVMQSVSDLEDFERRDAPRGAMDELMNKRSGMPPKPEIEAMAQRWETARGSLRNATLTVYPFHVWGGEEGSAEIAETLARNLTKAGFAQATATRTDPHLMMQANPNELRVLWDTARAFRSYLREQPADSDYALLVDVSAPPNVHHVHLILCEGNGEWVLVDLQNSHHSDFQQVNPDSLADCEKLAERRLALRLQASD